MVEAMRKKADNDGADVWLRIIVAIRTLGDTPTKVRGIERAAAEKDD